MRHTEIRLKTKKFVNWQLYSMLIPGLALMLIFNYLPMAGIVLAFKDIDYSGNIFSSPWIGLKNFEFLFRTPDAWVITRNTLLYNFAFIVLGLVLSVALAILLNELRQKKAAKLYQSLIFLPYILSWVIVSFLLYAFLSPEYGFINKYILPFLGIEKIQWYTEAKYWPYLIIFLNLWKNVGYNSVVYIAAIAGIDKQLYEAAEIDGATKWQQIKYITIPSLSTLMFILTILNIGKIFYSDFGLFYQATLNSGPLYPVTNVVDTYVFRALMVTGDTGMAAAAALYQSVLGFILVVSANYITKKIDPDKSLY